METTNKKQKLKNRTVITTSLANDIHSRLKDYSDKTMIPMTKLLDDALRDYFVKHDIY